MPAVLRNSDAGAAQRLRAGRPPSLMLVSLGVFPSVNPAADSNTAKRFGRAVAYGFAAAPAVAVALFYSAIVHWRLILGHWPSGKHPSPYPVGIGEHEWLVFLFCAFVVCSFPVWLTFVIFIKRFVLSSLRMWPLLLSWAAAVILWFIDPGGFVWFYFD